MERIIDNIVHKLDEKLFAASNGIEEKGRLDCNDVFNTS